MKLFVAKAKLLAEKKSTKFQPANIKERRKKSVEKDLKGRKLCFKYI